MNVIHIINKVFFSHIRSQLNCDRNSQETASKSQPTMSVDVPLQGILDNIACPDSRPGHPSWVTMKKLYVEIYLQVGILETKFCSSHCGRVDSQLNPFCFRSGWLGLSCSEVGSLCRSTRAGLLLHLLRIDLENFLEMGQRPVAESGKKRRMVGAARCSRESAPLGTSKKGSCSC